MNQAKIIETGRVIDARDLLNLEDPRSLHFVCPDDKCSIALSPCSYGKGMRKDPYFRIQKINTEHNRDCSFSTFATYARLGRIKRLDTVELVKMDFPAKFKLPERKPKEVIIQKKSVDDLKDGSKSGRKLYSDEFSEEKHSKKVVTSINQIVDFYVNCPYNRDVELNLLGHVDEYAKLFMEVYNGPNLKDNQPRIFFAKPNFKTGTSAAKQNENKYEIILYEGYKKDDGTYEPFVVEIDTSEITHLRLNRLKRDREKVVAEQIEKHKGKNSLSKIKNTDESAYFFFLAPPPSAEEPHRFKAIHGMGTWRYTHIPKTITI